MWFYPHTTAALTASGGVVETSGQSCRLQQQRRSSSGLRLSSLDQWEGALVIGAQRMTLVPASDECTGKISVRRSNISRGAHRHHHCVTRLGDGLQLLRAVRHCGRCLRISNHQRIALGADESTHRTKLHEFEQHLPSPKALCHLSWTCFSEFRISAQRCRPNA